MKTRLVINTSTRQEISVALVHNGRTYERTVPARIAKAQTALPLTEELLKEAGIVVQDVQEITVVEGDESLTGVRVGFAIANAIGILLDIPVNGKKALAFPAYKPVHYQEVDGRK